jgi:hypothetical protein
MHHVRHSLSVAATSHSRQGQNHMAYATDVLVHIALTTVRIKYVVLTGSCITNSEF